MVNVSSSWAAVIEKVCKERPQDYLKVAAALLPKQMETETNRARPFELSDAEILNLLLDGSIEEIVEAIMIFRRSALLTSAQRQQLQQWEQEIASANLEAAMARS
jgi:hypothetical protein